MACGVPRLPQTWTTSSPVTTIEKPTFNRSAGGITGPSPPERAQGLAPPSAGEMRADFAGSRITPASCNRVRAPGHMPVELTPAPETSLRLGA